MIGKWNILSKNIYLPIFYKSNMTGSIGTTLASWNRHFLQSHKFPSCKMIINQFNPTWIIQGFFLKENIKSHLTLLNFQIWQPRYWKHNLSTKSCLQDCKTVLLHHSIFDYDSYGPLIANQWRRKDLKSEWTNNKLESNHKW